MPTYTYLCKLNSQKVEVIHSIHEKLNTWGELCNMAKIELGDTDEDTEITRIITGGYFNCISPTPKFDESILPK